MSHLFDKDNASDLPSVDDPNTLGAWWLDGTGYVLQTWDTGRRDARGQAVIGYAFGIASHPPLFTGEDFSGSPSHSDDSEETVRCLLGFLTLRPGDTDADFFVGYTDAQLRFCETEAEYLSLWSTEADDDPPGLVDAMEALGTWDEDPVRAAGELLGPRDGFDRLVTLMTDGYLGCYDSPEDWAEEYHDDAGLLDNVPESLRHCVDFELWARDAELCGDVAFVILDGLTYVFDGHV